MVQSLQYSCTIQRYTRLRFTQGSHERWGKTESDFTHLISAFTDLSRTRCDKRYASMRSIEAPAGLALLNLGVGVNNKFFIESALFVVHDNIDCRDILGRRKLFFNRLNACG